MGHPAGGLVSLGSLIELELANKAFARNKFKKEPPAPGKFPSEIRLRDGVGDPEVTARNEWMVMSGYPTTRPLDYFRAVRDSGVIARGGYHQGRFYVLRVPRLHWASRRVQFAALGPKILPVWFFDPILGELAGRALGRNDNTLAVTASHVRAEFQEEAIGRARQG